MVPVGGQKGLEIGLGNPNQSVDPVGYEKALLDPAANGSCRGVHTLGDLRISSAILLGRFSLKPSSTQHAATACWLHCGYGSDPPAPLRFQIGGVPSARTSRARAGFAVLVFRMD